MQCPTRRNRLIQSEGFDIMEKMRNEITYLNCPYSDKDKAKSLGARWDPSKKKWFVPAGVDISAFSAWLPENLYGSLEVEPEIPFLG